MKAKSSMMLAMAAGGVFAAGAMASEPNLTGDFASARIAGHVYVNVATGEVVRTLGSSRLGDIFWQNDDQGGCNFFYGQDRPTRDETLGRVKFGSAVVDWGDVAGDSFFNGYDAAYATNVGADTAGSGIVGLNMINTFIDDYDGDLDPGGTGASGILEVTVGDIAGGDATLGTALFQGWIYTIDIEGSGFEFNFGTTDLDADGLHDFAHAYSFAQTQVEAKGIIGPFLVQPFSLGGTGSAFGVVDAFDWFNQDGGAFTGYVGAFWFGGGACPTTPYGSFWMTMYGMLGGGGNPCDAIDYNMDGLIDFGDYLEFLNFYDAQDPAADLNNDGIVDFGDYLEFLNLFDACQ
ncbi:MAG: hypothetical protein IT436_10490 [Phycisphaerales bacterium]|nr:hypothetical protein [Phycisphaerales bacterium]